MKIFKFMILLLSIVVLCKGKRKYIIKDLQYNNSGLLFEDKKMIDIENDKELYLCSKNTIVDLLNSGYLTKMDENNNMRDYVMKKIVCDNKEGWIEDSNVFQFHDKTFLIKNKSIILQLNEFSKDIGGSYARQSISLSSDKEELNITFTNLGIDSDGPYPKKFNIVFNKYKKITNGHWELEGKDSHIRVKLINNELEVKVISTSVHALKLLDGKKLDTKPYNNPEGDG